MKALRLAYADPPYEGQAKKHYGFDPRAAEVNLALLVPYLETFDGWALSCKTNSLGKLLALAPGARVAAWCKPFAVSKPNVHLAYTWEPVVFRAARQPEGYCRDSLVSNPAGLRSFTGSKPAAFSAWLFRDLLAALPGDDLEDLFPGSGAVGQAWKVYQSQPVQSPLWAAA